MQLALPKEFWHVGKLAARLASHDPRAAAIPDGRLDVDMRECDFVRPAAVLRCVVYPLLASAKGASCRLLVPENMGLCVYLRSLGLLDMLRDASVEVDDRGIGRRVGILYQTEQMQRKAKRTTLFPGTLAYCSIPT